MADNGVGRTGVFMICERELCCGCGACVNSCPGKCITLAEDEYGQEKPVMDQLRCKKCNICRAVCPNNGWKEALKKKDQQQVYAGWRKEETKRRESSSGGLAALIAEYVIQIGGVVYGVAGKMERISYQRADTIEAVQSFRGSKYVQAKSVDIYREIEMDLRRKRKTLVIGTPCLIAGVLSYMNRKDSEKKYQKYIITIDLLCHGVVPQRYLREHISAISSKKRMKFDRIVFRSNHPKENYRFILKQNGKTVYYQRAESDLYFEAFLSGISIRESCINCTYKDVARCGDITLGDFLGLGKEIPFTANKAGIHPSLLLINSDTGKRLLKEVEDAAVLFPRTLQEAVKGGPSLRKNEDGENKRWKKRREKFQKAYPKLGFERAARKSIGDKVWLSLTKDNVKKVLKR